jgi:hypothetical protein
MIIIMDVTINLMAKNGATEAEIMAIFAKASRQGKVGSTMYLVFN